MSTHTILPDFLRINYTDQTDITKQCEKKLPFANSEIFHSKIKNVALLTQGEDVKTVFAISLDTEGINYKFQPGDTIGILPSNDDEEINSIFDLLGVSEYADKTYELEVLQSTTKKNPSIPVHVPHSSTLRTLFRKHLDIRCPPKKLFLRALCEYATSEDEIERLSKLATPQGSQDYNRFVSQDGRTLLGFLKAFTSCRPPIVKLIENLSPLHARPYSVSSSPLKPSELNITVAVVQVKETLKGVCSGWLERNIEGLLNKDPSEMIENEFKVPFYFRKPNSFRLPEDPTTAMLMIGPGTGVAPFIGFLQHLQLQKAEDPLHESGQTVLFFGCRYSDGDFIYKAEMQEHLRSGLLTKLYTSFSREGDKKMYVQDNIIKHGNEVVHKILQENALIYVCGDAKNMMRDVKNALTLCIGKYGDMLSNEAEDYVKELQTSNRYIEDIWV